MVVHTWAVVMLLLQSFSIKCDGIGIDLMLIVAIQKLRLDVLNIEKYVPPSVEFEHQRLSR